MLNEAYRVAKGARSLQGHKPGSRQIMTLGPKGAFASSTLEPSPKKNTPMKNLQRYLDKVGIRGSHKQPNLEEMLQL
jgi:hypothetical protein